MKIKVTKIEGKAVLFLRGTIDIPSAEHLKQSLHEILEEDVNEVVVDFSDVDSIGSSGVGTLLLAHKEFTARNIPFGIVNPHKEITALFKIIKLDKLFQIKP